MVLELQWDLFVAGGSLTRQPLVVDLALSKLLADVAQETPLTTYLDSYTYTALHLRQQQRMAFEWQSTPLELTEKFQNEARLSLLLINRKRKPDVYLHLCLNSEDEIVTERVEGRKRKVPKASDSSRVSMTADTYLFQDMTFTRAYINTASHAFIHTQGYYGRYSHARVQYDNDMDRVYGDRFMPRYITWCNLFGPALVEQLGRQRILNAPAHEVVELAGGGIMVLACANPLDELQPEVQERIAAIKQHLGILSPSERATPEERAAFEARTAQGQAKMKERIATAFREANEQTASEMVRLAEGCVRGVRHIWDLELDFSPASLQLVDEIIQHGFAAEEDEDTIEQAVVALGSYVGEVIRRWQGGKWRDVHFNGVPTLTAIGSQRRELNPFHLIRQRLKNRQQPASVSLQVTIETIVTAD
jgi:hypothetical protein